MLRVSLASMPLLVASLSCLALPPTPSADPAESVQGLSAHAWQRTTHPATGARELTEWIFYPDGTFQHRQVSDYAERWSGTWRAETPSSIRARGGVLFLRREAGPASETWDRAVVSFELGDEGLRLAEQAFRRTPLRDADPPQEPRQENPTERRDEGPQEAPGEAPSLWRELTSTRWSSRGERPPAYAEEYSLRPDGSYTAELPSTGCSYSGTWSLFITGPNQGQIRFLIPADSCAVQSSSEPGVMELPVELEDHRLLLYRTLYQAVDPTTTSALNAGARTGL